MKKFVQLNVLGILVAALTIGLLILILEFETAMFGFALIGIITCALLFGRFLSWAIVVCDEESQLTKREE